MATYTVQAPDGKIITLEGPEGASHEEVIRQAQRLYQPAAPGMEPKQATFGSAVSGGISSLLSQGRTALGAITGDAEAAAEAGIQRGQNISQEMGEIGSWDRTKQVYDEQGLFPAVGQAASDIPEMLGSQVGTLGAMAAGAKLGSMAGTAVAPGIGTAIGAGLGAGAALFLPQMGGNIEAQAQAQRERGEQPNINVGNAALGAAGQVALEGAATAATLGLNTIRRFVGAGMPKADQSAQLLEAAQRSLAGTAGRGVARGAAAEMPTEVAQQVIQRAQAGQDLLSEDALAEYGESAYAGGLAGGALGGISSPLDRSAARQQVRGQGVDPATGQPVATPAVDADRLARLQAEQAVPDREVERAAQLDALKLRQAALDAENEQQLQALTQPLDVSRDTADLQAEVEALRERLESGERDRRIRDRIFRVESELGYREQAAATTPETEAARRAEVNERELRRNPPENRARDATQTFLGVEFADTDTAVLAQMVDSNRKNFNELADDQRLQYTAMRRELTRRQKQQAELDAAAKKTRKEYQAELARIQRENQEAREALPQSLRADEVGRSNLPPIITEAQIAETGLPRKAGYVKRLEGLDLRVPEQRAQAAQVMREVRANQRVSQATKDRLDELLAKPEFQGIDLDAPVVIEDAQLRQRPVRMTPESVPVQPLNAEVFDALGIGKTAQVRRNPDIVGLDPTVPEQREQLLAVLDAYASGSGRSQRIADGVRTYMDRVRAMEQGDRNARPDTGADLPVQGTQPAPDQAGMGVVDRGGPSGPQRAPTAAPSTAGVNQQGLDNAGQVAQQPTPAGADRNAALEGMPAQAALANANIMQGGNPPISPRAGTQQYAQDQSARRGDYDPDVVFITSDAYAQAQSNGDLAGSTSPEFLAALEAGNLADALTVIRDNKGRGFNNLEALVADRLLQSGQPMPTIQIVDSLPARNGESPAGQYNAVTDTVQLVRGQADSHTMLHEVVHAFTHRFLMNEQRNGYRNPHAKALVDLYAHVRRMMPNADAYGLTNVSEFVAEAMSNPAFQLDLMGIPYRKQTAWGWFKDALRKVLGVPESNPVDNTLFAAIVHAEGLMNPGRQMQVDQTGQPVPNPIVNVVRTTLTPPGGLTPADWNGIAEAQTQELRTASKQFAATFQRSATDPTVTTRVRVKAFDQFASVEERLRSTFDRGMRNAMGSLNPINFLRQAVDYKRIALQVFKRGGLRKDADGYYTAYDLTDAGGNAVSPAAAIEQIRALAKEYGTTYEVAKGRVATVLEGMRLHSMREFNAEQERLARAFEAKNTKEDDKRADEARAKKKKLHMLNSEIDELVRLFEASPAMQNIQRTLNATRNNLIDQMIASGRLSEEHGGFWKDNINYVPFDRITEVMETSSMTESGHRMGIAQLGALPQLQGSYERPVANVINNYMDTLSWMVGQIMRNDGTVRVLDAMVEAGYAKKIPSRSAARNDKLVAPTVYVKGEPTHYELQSEYDLAAFAQGVDPENGLVNGLAHVSRLLRTTVTAMPTFSLNQTVQDTLRAGIQSGTQSSTRTAISTLLNFPKTVGRMWRGRESVGSETMHGYGVVGNYDYNPINPLDTLEHELGAVKYGAVGNVLHRLEQIAKASDQAAREAVYERTMAETKDHALAITRARELINFNRRGASGTARTLAKVVPFFNAYSQGLDLMYRGFTGRESPTGFSKAQAQKYVMGRLGMLTAMGFMYAGAMQDDEDYKNADDFVRDRGWIVPRSISSMFDGADGRHTPLVIPVPREFAFFFKSVPERIMGFWYSNTRGEDKLALDAAMDVVSLAKDTFLMEPVPAGLKPALENLTNYSFFTGRALVGGRLTDAPKPMQVNASTSELARALGEATNSSPILIDNFIRGTLGTAGTMALQFSDMFFNGNLPERPLNRVAGLSTFTAPEVGTRLTTEFYDLNQKVQMAVQGLKGVEEDPNAYEAYFQKHGRYLALEDWSRDKLSLLSDLRKAREMYQRREGMGTPAERRAALKELDEIQLEILSDVPTMRGYVERLQEQ